MISKQFILIIKHGALGDFIMLTPAFKAIRSHHPNAHIVLLTAGTYVDLAKKMPFFDSIWVDNREKWYKPWVTAKVRHLLNGGGVTKKSDRIYDLQASSRTGFYFKLLKQPKPEWVGKVKNCTFPRPFPPDIYHPAEIHQRHLATVGIEVELLPDVSWLCAGISQFMLPSRFVCLIPSCSSKHRVKRWTVAGYAALIKWLDAQGIVSVLLGSTDDRSMIDAIKAIIPDEHAYRDCCDKTTLAMIAEIARCSLAVIGSDTGPMHIAAATGTHTLILFSRQSKPAYLCAPKGEHVTILESDDLRNLHSHEVKRSCQQLLQYC